MGLLQDCEKNIAGLKNDIINNKSNLARLESCLRDNETLAVKMECAIKGWECQDRAIEDLTMYSNLLDRARNKIQYLEKRCLSLEKENSTTTKED